MHKLEFIYFEHDELTRRGQHDTQRAAGTIDKNGNVTDLDKVRALREAGADIQLCKHDGTGRYFYRLGAGLFEESASVVKRSFVEQCVMEAQK
ncbi:hypothetical protein RRL34_004269 [Vibrio parahaemolyticus]|nr:hypothetical protein [Vibrio parahaemolyticus]